MAIKKRIALFFALLLMLMAVGASASVKATLRSRMATRSGPGTRYTEMGSYFRRGEKVNAVSKVYDERNRIWWIQVEFKYRNTYRRAYTGHKRVNVGLKKLEEEKLIATIALTDRVIPKYGPGDRFEEHTRSLAAGTQGKAYWQEEGWWEMEINANGTKGQTLRRVWVPDEFVEVIAYADEVQTVTADGEEFVGAEALSEENDPDSAD